VRGDSLQASERGSISTRGRHCRSQRGDCVAARRDVRAVAARRDERAVARDEMTRGARTRARVDAEVVRRTLRDEGLRARRDRSQNFLVDTEVLDAILAEADPKPGGRILEIGPGLGILTGALLDAGANVTAIELDEDLVGYVRRELAAAIARGTSDGEEPRGALRLIHGDALDQSLTRTVEPPYDVVANLPYHITSPILHALLGDTPRPRRLVLMVQREVAERIAASPGRMSYLSVFAQYHARVRIARIVRPDSFEPAPDVDSAILVLEPYPEDDRLPDADAENELWRLVQAAFRERRKMLHNVLTRQLPVSPQRVDAALAATGIAPDRRPQTLAVGEWLALREALSPIGPDERGRRVSEPRGHEA
jgi:16S rRNA (adenine1518-N6/adenine1519-N6)-dimethyltransferase